MKDYHSFKIETCYKELKSSQEGLTNDEVKRRLKKNGPNKLPKKKPLSALIVFINQFKSPLIYILIIAGLISAALLDFIDAGVIFGAVILNTVIGFFQENKANKALEKLKKLVEHKAIVVREGREIEIKSSELVAGDIINIKAGSRIPADARLITTASLQLNEASLTGESLPSSKHIEPLTKGATLADRENMVYASTVVVHGSGQAIVTATGVNTEIGRIAQLVKETEDEKTPLQKRLDDFSRYLGIFLAVICFFIVFIGFFQGRPLFEMFLLGVAIAVASIPEGLSMAVTVTLSVGMQAILKQKALIRKLVAAETLGSTTVICTDKTGTLTEGRMHVAHIVIGEKEFEVKSKGSRQDSAEAKIVSLALQAAMMCNDASIENPEDELASWRIIGEPTDAALMSAAVQSGLDKKELLKIEPQIDELPFESDIKYMVSLHKAKNGHVLYEKGAPEKLLAKATKYYHQGKICTLSDSNRIKLDNNYQALTNKGLRVIGVAMRKLGGLDWSGSDNWDKIDRELTFIGFIALKDPLRKEAKATIKETMAAGIRPIIITGDHQLTARAIAEEIGLNVNSENILTGEQLDKISDDELRHLVKKVNIFARVSPHHKLRIVKLLQDRGEVVAMTGDGINDSPALKAADIGISVGTGTDIAKETADIVLLDDNFKTIVSAVRQGRIIFSNIRKAITYLVSDSFSEMIMIIGAIMLGSFITGLPLPILPAQILWINIVNDGLPHFALAFEKGGKGIMEGKPIKKNEPILNKEMKMIIFGVGFIRDLFIFSIFLYLYFNNFDTAYIRTVIFAALATNSLMYIFSLRSFKKPIWRTNPFSNYYLIAAVSVSSALMLLGIYWPPLQKVLSTVPLNASIWFVIVLTGVMAIALIEAVKIKFSRLPVKSIYDKKK